jgi:hypothetical protein
MRHGSRSLGEFPLNAGPDARAGGWSAAAQRRPTLADVSISRWRVAPTGPATQGALVRASLPPVLVLRPYLGRERAADARTDIPPRRPYNDGASLPRQDRNATQGGASPRPCRPFSSRHSPWAGADGRTRAASGRFVASHRHPTGGCLPSQRWGYARERPAGPTLRPTFRPRGGGLVVKI